MMSELIKNAPISLPPDASELIPPHGGFLLHLMVPAAERNELQREAAGLESLQISPASASQLAMLSSGAFSPLDRFLGEREHQSVVQTMRLTTGALCPLPITLPAGDALNISPGSRIALRDMQNRLLACMTVDEAFDVLRTEPRHSRSSRMSGGARTRSERLISGPLQVFHIPADLQFPNMWSDPAAIRQRLSLQTHQSVVAVDHWEPRDEQNTEWLRAIARERGAILLLNLAGAEQRVDAFDHFQHLRECRDAFAHFFSARRAILNFVHLESSLSSEQQILWHAIVHKNYGAGSYVIDSSRCKTWTASYDRNHPENSKTLQDGAAEIGVELIFRNPSNDARYTLFSPVHSSSRAESQIEHLSEDISPVSSHQQDSFSSPSTFHVPSESGLCLWLTGLPCSGKSAIAEQLLVLLMEGGLRVTLLDGDTVRTHLSKGLTFSKEDRDTNVQRIGFVASEIVRHGGVVICAAVSPWRESREKVRQMMPGESFVEIFVDTPVEVCEQRDVKGFYARARAGQISHFTGVNDPYEAPLQSEMVLKTEGTTEQTNADLLLQFLIGEHYLIETRKAPA